MTNLLLSVSLTATTGTTTSSTTLPSPITSSAALPSTSTSGIATTQSTNTSLPPASAGEGWTLGNRIAIGTALGFGIPGLLVAVATFYVQWQRRNRRNQLLARQTI